MKNIDVRGLSCPEPVIRTRTALKNLPQGETVSVLVDTVTSRENILRAISSLNCDVSVEENAGEFKLIITPKA